MADDEGTDPKKGSGGGSGGPESAWTALLKSLGDKLLTAILTTGGLVAFAAFAGGIVVWTRYSALQLPQDQIVDVVPRGELVTAGATVLLLFGFCGAAAAFAVYLIDRGGRGTPGMSRGVLVLVALEAITAVWLAGGTKVADRVIATEVVVLAFGAILWATCVGGLVNLKQSETPDLYGEEEFQEIEGSAFRNPKNEWKDGTTKAGIAILVAAVAGLVVVLCVTRPDWEWVWGLAAFGGFLLAAVLLQWALFERREREARKKRKEDEEGKEEERRNERKKEGERGADAERLAAAEAEEERRADRIAGVVSWLRASWKRQRGGRSLTIEVGSPEADPRPRRWKDEENPAGEAPREKPPSTDVTVFGAMVMAPLAIIAVALPAAILGQNWLAFTMAAIIGLGLGLWRMANLFVGRFIWFALAVLLSVPFFGTVALATRNLDDPQAQPVAIIRKSDGPGEALQGLYVTETDKRVYFANIATRACEKKIVEDSGRLLWIPKGEVVAMAIGPSQDIDKAARASVEMAHSLTPDIETAGGGLVHLETDEERESEAQMALAGGSGSDGQDETKGADAAEASMEGGEKEEGEGEDKGEGEEGGEGEGEEEVTDHRLETAGPAVRSKFGRGMYVVPKVARPGERVKLFISSPEFGGFSDLPKGFSLRLGEVKLTIVEDKKADRVDMKEREVSEDKLHEEKLEFEVPKGAHSGVVTPECTQLAGSAYLTIPQKPVARVAVRMQEGSRKVSFDSSSSTDASGKDEKLTRRWTVAGAHMGQSATISAELPPRLAPYHVDLQVTDAKGRTDGVDLTLLRLPQSRFPFGADRPASRKPMQRVRRELRHALRAAQRKKKAGWPAAIEIDGHADSVDTDQFNFDLSLRRALWMRRRLFALHRRGGGLARTGPALVNRGERIPLTVHAFGESCPIVHAPGPQAVNRRVEVFVLGPGARVAPPKGCRIGRSRIARW